MRHAPGSARGLGALAAAVGGGRAVASHLTLPLVVVLRGAAFLPLLLARPSETTLAVGAAQARAGLIDWPVLIGIAVVGAVASDGISYFLGRTLGESALHRLISHRHGGRLARPLGWVRARMDRHGGPVIALARPTVITHGAVPVLAGISGVPPIRFLAWSTIGAGLWAVTWAAGTAALLNAGVRQPAIFVAFAVVAGAGAMYALACRRDVVPCPPRWA